MNNNNEETKRTFVPKTLGESLKKINKSFSSKYGEIEYIIISKWPQIVGTFFAKHSEPEKITKIPKQYNEYDENDQPVYEKCLVAKVSPAAALEFQHFKDVIIEKINSYFGYKAISKLTIKQNFLQNEKNTEYHKKDFDIMNDIDKKFVSKNLKKLKDVNLEKSILKLGIAINKKNRYEK